MAGSIGETYGRHMTRTSLIALLAVALLAGCGSENSDRAGGARAAKAEVFTTVNVNGELIAFDRIVPGAEERDLYAVGADGGEPRLLRSPGEYPHWSPDGSVLAFNAYGYGYYTSAYEAQAYASC